jgi:nicotianamine synthase
MDALRMSADLSRKLGLGERMTFSCEDVAPADEGFGEVGTKSDVLYTNGDCRGEDKMFKKTDWAAFQVVVLAALVGMDSAAKIEILASLRKKLAPGTLVVARSAEGLRGVLYPVCCSLSDFLLLYAVGGE